MTDQPRPYSTTSTARNSIDCGSARPSAFAVLPLMTRSSFMGCSTGNSAGWAPFQDSVDIDRRAMILVRNVRPVAGQEPSLIYAAVFVTVGNRFLIANSAILLMSTCVVLSG